MFFSSHPCPLCEFLRCAPRRGRTGGGERASSVPQMRQGKAPSKGGGSATARAARALLCFRIFFSPVAQVIAALHADERSRGLLGGAEWTKRSERSVATICVMQTHFIKLVQQDMRAFRTTAYLLETVQPTQQVSLSFRREAPGVEPMLSVLPYQRGVPR